MVTSKFFGFLCLTTMVVSVNSPAQLERHDPVVTHRAIVETTLGTFEIDLYGKDAPRTVENFVGLSGQGYFKDLLFHRVSRGFVIQTGDPTGTGAGGRSLWGKPFADELNADAPSYRRGYERGTVAMANRGPNTNTSQWFVTLRDSPSLPKAYTIFGGVRSGMDVVDKIGLVELTPRGTSDGRPAVDIRITSVTIVVPEAETPPDKRGW